MEIYMNELTLESPYELHKDLKFIKDIDQGAFGKVIHVYETKKNLDLAIKVINKTGLGSNSINEMKEEISILKKLNHSNIVKFYGYSETNNQLLIKMEYIKYGTLSKWMKGKPKIKEEDASKILKAVLSAVEYMHSMHICHRDIKPENIMLSEENNLSSVKIIDFGLSAQHFNYLANNEYCGTYIYMAPEQIEKKLYHYSVDIWSIGILMFMLLNGGKHPFYQKNDKKEDFIKKIKIGKLYFINKLSFMAKNLNQKLCEVNPSWRYSANLAIKHPWITRNPNDEIPLTFNEILNRNNSKKNWNNLIMICIFLNHYKKKEINLKEVIKNKLSKNFYIDNFLKKKKNRIFKITNKYLNKCNAISQKEKEKYLKIRERCLEAESTDEEDSIEKKKTLEIAKSKRSSLRKNTKFNITQNNYNINNNNNLNNKNKNKKLHFNEKAIKDSEQKEKKRDSNKNIYILSMPNKNKKANLNSYRHAKSDEIKLNNLNNSNNNNTNINKMRCKSISKFNLSLKDKNKERDENKFPTNLPYVSKSGVKSNSNVKKYHNNIIRNYQIIPLVLPYLNVNK